MAPDARELARDGQAKACSAVLPCGRGIGLREFLEELGLLALRQDPELAEIPVIMITIVDEHRRGVALGAAECGTNLLGLRTSPAPRPAVSTLKR